MPSPLSQNRFPIFATDRQLSESSRLKGDYIYVTWEPKDWEYSSPDLILPNFKSLSKPMIDGLKSKGFPVIPYTVNEEADWQKVLELGVDGIITDRPDLLAVFLATYVRRL